MFLIKLKVKRDIILEVYSDIYAAMTVIFNKSFIVIDYPFTIGGICKSSTTAQGMTGGHRGELKTAPHLHLRGIMFGTREFAIL